MELETCTWLKLVHLIWRQVCQTRSEREQGGLGAIGEMQFAEDIADVTLDCLWTNKERLSNIIVGLTICDQFKYIKFALR